VVTRLQATLAEAGVADLAVSLQPLGRPLAPGLYPYVAPDFLEDSLLITTLMQVAGLALPSFVATALMTLGPLLRRFTRNIRAQDEHTALLTAARAATMEAGAALERQVDQAFAGIEDALELAATPPPPIEVLPIDDTERREATARVDAVLALFAPFGANPQLDAGRHRESHGAPRSGPRLVGAQGSVPGDAESSPPDPVLDSAGARGSAPSHDGVPEVVGAPGDASSHDGIADDVGAHGDAPSHHDAPDGVGARGSAPSDVHDDVGAPGSAPSPELEDG